MKMNKTKDFFSFNNCYIMPLNIISLINKFIIQNKALQNDMKNMYLKNKDIYFIDSNRIIIGNLHNEYFIPKYILLLYDTQNIINAEKEISYSNEIDDYIISKNCDINNNNIQDLISENKIIGKFITLMNSKIDKYKSEKIICDSKSKNITNSENKYLLINKCRNLPSKKLYERTKKLNTQNSPDFSNDANKNKVFQTEATNEQKNLETKNCIKFYIVKKEY